MCIFKWINEWDYCDIMVKLQWSLGLTSLGPLQSSLTFKDCLVGLLHPQVGTDNPSPILSLCWVPDMSLLQGCRRAPKPFTICRLHGEKASLVSSTLLPEVLEAAGTHQGLPFPTLCRVCACLCPETRLLTKQFLNWLNINPKPQSFSFPLIGHY